MAKSFAHLHTHSSHSVRDAIARHDDLFEAVRADGQPAIAITDHGNLSGLFAAHESARAHEVSLIAGVEAYMAVEDGDANARFRRVGVAAPIVGEDQDGVENRGEKKYTHLTLLAETAQGLRNLMTLASRANEDTSFWSRPRMDLTLLSEHAEGIIALSGCLGGAVKSRLVAGDVEGARLAAAQLCEIFGPDNFFIEVMSHGIVEEDALNAQLIEIATKLNVRVVATNDSHFTHATDAHAHEAWLCGASGQTLSDPTHWKFTGSGYHLRSSAEMRAIFDHEPGFEAACDNTLLIAERTTAYELFPKHQLRIPTFDPQSEQSAAELLYERVREGAKTRYGSPLPPGVKERLRYELDTIGGAGLADYFLIVADMIDWAKRQGIRVGPGRGSAAGSCVSYCMRIIAVDPIKHGLLFERFLNPTRNKMPDIDTDFEQGRRQEVVNYLIERWGHDSVALIGTLGLSLSKNSLRVAGKVLGNSALGVRLSEQVPTLGDGKTPTVTTLLDEKFAPGDSFRNASRDAGEFASELIEIARRFEGVVNTESIHPCGVVIGDEQIIGQIPLRSDRRASGTGGWVSEFDGEALESLGYLKMDVLGLLTLDVVEACVREIERRHGMVIDVDAIADDDGEQAKRAWAVVGSGRTEGVFQLDGGGMQELARRLRPISVDELGVLIALYRPGPLGIGMHDMYANRKAGLEKVSYDIFTKNPAEVEVIKSVLNETLAVLVFQEQLIRIAELVAGFNPPERDNLLRAIGKKNREQMDRSGELFITGAQSDLDMAGQSKLAFSKRTAENLWDAMKSSGEYSFNKSHSVGYARLSFVTAWLKANYSAEFAAGWLGCAENQEKRLAFLASLNEEGIILRAPDVNRSLIDPAVGDDGSVLLGLGKIRDVGSVGEEIVAERERNGDFVSLFDLATRVRMKEGTRRVSITALRALIESGACDSFGPRRGMFEAIDQLRKKSDTRVPTSEWGLLERSVRERIRLGVLVSENPLAVFGPQIKEWRSPSAPDTRPLTLHNLPDAGRVQTIGIVTSWEINKRKTRFAKMTLAGTKSTIDCVIWNSPLDRIEEAGLVPTIGSIIGVDAEVKMKTAYRQLVDESEDEVPVKELVVSTIWTRPLVDDTAIEDDYTSTAGSSAAPTLFDSESSTAVLLLDPPRLGVPDDQGECDIVLDAGDTFFGPEHFGDDDGFQYPLVKAAPVTARPRPRVAAKRGRIDSKERRTVQAGQPPDGTGPLRVAGH